MAKNDIAVNLMLRNQQYVRGMDVSKAKMQELQRQTQRTRQTMNSLHTEVVKGEKAARNNTSSLHNLIFAAEDAASVYGTMGLAGAVRAASNNITMIAAAYGPYAMVAAVAVTTTIQLYFAFNQAAKNAEAAKKAAEEYKKTLNSLTSEIEKQVRLQEQIKRLQSSEEAAGLADKMLVDHKVAQEQSKALQEQLQLSKKAVEEAEKRKKLFEGTFKEWFGPSRAVDAVLANEKLISEEKGKQKVISEELAKARKEELEAQKRLLEVQQAQKRLKTKEDVIAQNAAEMEAMRVAQERAAQEKERIAAAKNLYAELRKSMLNSIDPEGRARRDIEERRQQRIAQIEASDMSDAEKMKLIKMANEAAAAERVQAAEFDKLQSRDMRNYLLTSSRIGSKEATDAIIRHRNGQLTDQKKEEKQIVANTAKAMESLQRMEDALLNKAEDPDMIQVGGLNI